MIVEAFPAFKFGPDWPGEEIGEEGLRPVHLCCHRHSLLGRHVDLHQSAKKTCHDPRECFR